MDSGGNMQSNEERGAEKLMDNYLKSIGLHRKKIAKDGSCLFRAVAEQVLHCQSLHTEVRAKCVEFLKQNRDSYEAFIEGDFSEYLCKLQDPQQWVGEVEINALAVIYKRDFLIFQEPGKPPVKITDNNFKEQVQLCFLNGNHYDSVYPVSHIKSAALCQSILYELLYERVFQVDRRSLQLCQRVGRPHDLLSDDSMAACASSDDSDVDAEEPLWVENGPTSSRQSYRGRGRGRQLPERVKRSLNPTLLRNVEYDVWHKSKRAQQKMDYGIAAGMQFTVGDRCQVREGKGRSYNATIKEVASANGLVTVHIEDVGKKQVPLWNLRPPSSETSWSTVVNREKRLSNGHGEWEERAKGRGRGRSIPAPASVSQETAAGSSGRLQKQNSWHPQATIQEQGGGKSIRRSMSTTESALSLTEKQHLAKEVEEMNMESFEIELRDEQSFPALGCEGARKKGGETRRSLRNKTKSPVEDIGPSSPPVAAPSASSAPSTNSTTSTSPTLPAAKPPAALSANSNSASLNPLKASLPSVNTASAASGPASSLSPTSAAKTNAPSYASAAAAPASPPPAATLSFKPILSPTSHPSFVTPFLPAASSPPAHSTLSSSSLPTFAPSPPPSSSVSPPTFIAPIAPSPTAAQVFPRSFSPIASLPHSPSPPSSSSLIPPSVQVKETPTAQPTNSLPKTEGILASETVQSQTALTQMLPQDSVPQNLYQVPTSQAEKEVQHSVSEIHPERRASLSQSQVTMPQMQTEARSTVPQHRPQSHTEVASEPQTLLQPQSEGAHIPLPGASHPLVQPPHPYQVPHPSLSLSASTTLSSVESANTQTQSEAPAPPPPKPQSPSQPPTQPSHPQSVPPVPYLQSIVPLQQMSQIYQDPLYPGFPQGEKGEMATVPSYSYGKSGDDLPQDVNILRFFFNLGVKAYSMPMFAPYLYLLPLQQTHTMHPKPSSHSPPPQYPPSNPPARQQEACMPPQYPPTSVSVPSQYDSQTSIAEPPNPSEPAFSQAGYQAVPQPPPHRMPTPSIPWQQMPPPRNSSFPVGYPSPPPPYSGPPPSSQGYHPGQGPVHSMYPSATPQYPPFALGYQSSSTPEELQVTQGVMEPLQPTNGDQMPGYGHVRVLGPLDSPGAANVANANNRRIVVSPNYALKEAEDGTTRMVLLVDPPLDNKQIRALIADTEMKDSSVAGATMKPGSSPGSPSSYRGHRKQFNSTKPYVPLGPEASHVGYPPPFTMGEPMSVACSTEDDFEEMEGFRQPAMNHMGQRKSYRGRGGGGRGRGGHDAGRGAQRRRHGDAGEGLNSVPFSSYRMRGRGRGY
ncbi:OTU domain-containing protein 4 [Leuresthes tenuis]|uniref:OTU domain-containing protein 4 n=1 Tax=Leuresthes tenuis TaxID=355514 RepID=UPI003B505C1A